ncbi:MAG: hypothetical protein C4541_13365 [Candidatus Auribacter fodinae]|jgi:hypothetical protein|uniref:Uncharacterized protein n=1 Tax=Candidatus Auribacter fodinae TaxID=2093366 RepID=A0A3A4R136_9BACT|nr:MAG: hypothetical protein C4541_13365 [Candidatus Auribacter fodinae]
MRSIIHLALLLTLAAVIFSGSLRADDTINLDGSYFYGGFSSHSPYPYEPYTAIGDQYISGSSMVLTLNFSDDPPSQTFLTITNTFYDSEGWLNLIVELDNETYHEIGIANDWLAIFVMRDPGVDEILDITYSLKKKTAPTIAEIAGEYSIFGHYSGVGSDEMWSSSMNGAVTLGLDGSLTYSVTPDFGDTETGASTYTLNASTSTIYVTGVGEFLIGEGGMLMRFDRDASDNELFYEILVKRSSGKTLADFEGCWKFQAFAAGDNTRAPYTAWGLAVVFNDGTCLVSNDYYGYTSETVSAVISASDNGVFTVTSNLGYEYTGILSPASDAAIMQIAIDELYHSVGTAIKIQLDPSDDNDNDGISNNMEFAQKINPLNPDTDSDGMPDGWELANTLSPRDNDAESDTDLDGLTALREYSLNTNPNNDDSDNDGFKDGDEITAGTNPNDNISFFTMVYINPRTNTLCWVGATTASYRMSWKDSFDEFWHEVTLSSDELVFQSDTVSYTDNGDDTSVPARLPLNEANKRLYKITAY